MAYIVSGDSSNKLTIETGKVARISTYGREFITARPFAQCPVELARGSLSFGSDGIVSSTTLALWALRNSVTDRFIRINAIYIQIFTFPDGLGGAELKVTTTKSRNVTSISGGTVLTPSIFKTGLGQATGIDSRFRTNPSGITVTDEVVIGEVLSFGSSNTIGGGRLSLFQFGINQLPYSESIDLLNNEALVMRGNVNATFNASFFATIFFTEYAFP